MGAHAIYSTSRTSTIVLYACVRLVLGHVRRCPSALLLLVSKQSGRVLGWTEAFPSVEIVPLELPGHGFRSSSMGSKGEEPEGDIHALASMIAESMFPTSRAFALIGEYSA